MIQHTRDERRKLGDRLSILFQVHADLKKSHDLLDTARTAGPLDAVKMIAEALQLYMRTQMGQAETNMGEMKETITKLDEALKEADSMIARPTHMHVPPVPGQGGRR
jgi:hypothetical protein